MVKQTRRKSPTQRETAEAVIAYRVANADWFYLQSPNVTNMNLGISNAAGRKARDSQVYRERMEELKRLDGNRNVADAERVRSAMSALVPQAMRELENALNDEKGEVRIKAAVEILDRDGRLPKVSRIQNEGRDGAALPAVDPEIIKEFHGNKTVN